MSEDPKISWRLHKFQFWLFNLTGLGPNNYKSKLIRILYDGYSYTISLMYILYSVMTVTDMAQDLSEEFGVILLRSSILIIGLAIACKRSSLAIEGRREISRLNDTMQEMIDALTRKRLKWVTLIVVDHYKLYCKIVISFYILGMVTATIFIGGTTYFDVDLFPLPYAHLYTVFGGLMYWWQCIMVIFTYISFLSYDMVIFSILSRITTYQEIVCTNWINFAVNFPSINFNKYISQYGEPVKLNKYDDTTELLNFVTKNRMRSYDENMRYDKDLMKKSTAFFRESCIHYQNITSVLRRVSTMFNVQLLLHFMFGVIVVALMSVTVILGDIRSVGSHRIVCFLVCALYDITIYCYYGTKLEASHTAVAAAVFNCPWYEMNVENRKAIVPIIHSLQHKGTISAGGFFPVNFTSCLSFYKISYNFIALLRSAT
ncbi:UNVERIFIED_CONTAM: hypothetical protein PYX00_003962 [Menopon gallinae]|uniref:Odorant receptor n=1 Tax=Menopon gallinae TaxID=328185 RepID=A0AAW2I299_9NEOP